MEIQKEVINAIAKHLAVTPQDIDVNASLRDDLGLGLIEVADLLAELSKKFEVAFVPAETENIDTINDLVELIEDLTLE